MGFQRAPNMKPAALRDGDRHSSMQLLEFFKSAREQYLRHDHEAESFVCEQIITHLKEGGRLEASKAARILGI
jgi:hypothetical protein